LSVSTIFGLDKVIEYRRENQK